MTKEILIKFLNNRCTAAELDDIYRWVNSEASTDESRNNIFNEWKNYRTEGVIEDDEKFSLLFDKIQQKIDSKNSQNRYTILITKWLTRAAAILLIPVLAFLFFTLSEKKAESAKYANLAVDSLEIVSPIGSRTVVHLSDGTEVHLNYGSKLKYPLIFSDHAREVKLSGEGFFKVAHNPEKPFIVKTGNLNVKALGTTFNVFAYPDKDFTETTLVDGKVVLEQNNTNGEIETIGAMIPGQHINYNIETGEVLSTVGNVEKYIAWKDGKMVFEDASIAQVVEKLNRMFNVDIEVSHNVKDYLYTVTFVDEPLFQILDLMAIATPISYKTLPRKKLPDGTFSKQKIIIERRN